MEGVAAVVVCTDLISVNSWALSLLRIGGKLVALGLPPEKWQFDASLLVFRELTIMGSYVASAESTRRMMQAVERSGIQSQISRVSFEDVPKLTEWYAERKFKGRMVVEIGQEI